MTPFGRVGLPLILLTALLLHWATIDRQSLFIDEVNELQTVRKPAAEIMVEPDSMPPFYPLLAKGWLTIFATDTSIRWLSAIFSLATVVVIWKTAKDEITDRAGMAAALIAAFSPFLLYYGQLIRGYALYTLLVAALLYFFLRAKRTDRWQDWACFAVVGVIGSYTHYYFPLFLGTSALILLAERRVVGIKQAEVMAFGAIGLTVLPLLLLLQTDMTYQQVLRDTRPLGVVAFGYTYISFLTGYCLGPSKAELHDIPVIDAALEIWPWGVLLTGATLTLAYFAWPVLQRRQLIVPLLTWLVLPVLLAGLVGQLFDLTFNVRFVAPCVIPLVLWLAAGVSAGEGSWLARGGLAVILILGAIATYNRHFDGRYQTEDARSATNYLLQHAMANEPIFAVSDYMASVLKHYLPASHDVWSLPDTDKLIAQIRTSDDRDRALKVIREKCGAGKPFWLFYSRPFHGDPQRLLLRYLTEQGIVEFDHEFAGVQLYRGVAPN